MLDVTFTAESLVSLFTLTTLEIVLGIDNIVIIAIISNSLPEHERDRARIIGLALALITRLLLLFSLTWLASLTQPLFTVMQQPFSGRDLIMLTGGLFLIVKATREIHEVLDQAAESDDHPRRVTSFRSAIAQIVLLAHTGSFVPAESAEIGPVDQIFTRIGSSDDLAGGRSTFMVEMTEAANILHNATSKSLVLIDEIGRGTSTFDGLALAYAIARHLAETTRSYTLFATHYFELTRLNAELPNIANVHLDAVEHKDRIVFLHKLESGPANQSYGLQVAGLAGVPKSVIRTARKHLVELEQQSIEHSPQGDLFAGRPQAPSDAAAAKHPAVEALSDIEPDELSPKEALETLYRLKRLSED